MKKITLFIFSLLAAASLATAQNTSGAHGNSGTHANGGQKLTPEQKAQKVTQFMTTELGLTADQQQKVGALNSSRATQMQQIKTKYNGDMKAAQTELKPLREKYKADLKAILTAEQAAKWEQIKQARKTKEAQTKTPPVDGITTEDLE